MIASNRKKMWRGFIPGILLSNLAYLLPFPLAFQLIGLALYLYGCIHFSVGKGYPAGEGFIGLIPIFGIFILWFRPDKHRDQRLLEDDASEYEHACPECSHPFRLSDYRPDAIELGCSRCLTRFARPEDIEAI